MPTIDIFNTKGLKTGRLSLPKEIFGVQPNPVLMAQAARVYLSNQRQAPAKTKTRGEVACSTRKIWRQKGTGRARHGARSAPIFVKGGVAHGPTGEQNYKLSLSKKMKRMALKSALTSKLKDGEIIFLEGLEKIKGKTKEMEKIMSNVKCPRQRAGRQMSNFKKNKKKLKISIVLPDVWEKVIRAGRNIPYLQFLQARQLNTYEVLNGGMLIFTKESVGVLRALFTPGVEISEVDK